MAHYNDYKKYHEALNATNFSELSNIILQVESSSGGYKNLSDIICNVEWEGSVKSALSLKLGILANSMQALQVEVSVNVGSIIDIGKELLEVLEVMRTNQANYDSSYRTIYELKKKMAAAKKIMEETPDCAANYTDICGEFFSIENKYEAALSDPGYYQRMVDKQAVKADELIKRLQEISFGANIDGILGEQIVYEKEQEEAIVFEEEPQKVVNLSYIININENMSSDDIFKAINDLKDKLKKESDLLDIYNKQLSRKISMVTIQIMTLQPGTPEYMEACAYQSELLSLKNKIETAYSERLNFYQLLEDDTYGGVILFGWGKSEFCSAVQKGNMEVVNTYIDQYNSSSKEFVSLEGVLTPKFTDILENVSKEAREGKYVDNSLMIFARKNNISEQELLSGQHNDLLKTYLNEYSDSFVMFSEHEGVNNEEGALLKLKIQETYVDAAVNGELLQTNNNIQSFSMNEDDKIYTYEYNTMDKTYSLISINVDGAVSYYDGSVG